MVAAFAAGHGAWHRTRWGPWAAVLYGLVTGTMVALLGPILDLPEEAHLGLLGAGVTIFAVGLLLGKLVQRLLRPSTTP